MIRAKRVTQNLKSILIIASALALALALVGCRQGGEVAQETPNPLAGAPVVRVPTITSPSTSTHYSKTDSVKITGLCMRGSTVQITGADTQTLPCLQSTFSFEFPKTTDGVYSYIIYQTSDSGLISGAAVITWVRKTSVGTPNITYPAQTPFQSGLDSLTLQGSCETGAKITASGASSEELTCTNSQFELEISKFLDGDYDITLTQSDLAGNSASTLLQWKKRRLVVSPSSISLQATTSRTISISGGSGTYTVEIETNLSGGSFDSETLSYSAGIKAGVIDRIKITDSLGAEIEVPASVIAQDPDHFVIPLDSGSNQLAQIGTEFTSPIRVQIVDVHNNGIASYPLRFSLLAGDAQFLDNPRQTTDAQGYAEIRVKAGMSSVISMISVRPASGFLPDIALSGEVAPRFLLMAYAAGSGKLGAKFGVGGDPNVTEIIDINKDGKKDVVVLNSGDSGIANLGVLLGNNAGLLQSIQRRQSCAGANHFILKDINSDSKEDAIITCPSSGIVASYLGNGDGTFMTGTSISLDETEYYPVASVAADFNKDAKMDLLVVSGAVGALGLRLGNGTGGFGVPTMFNPLGVPTGVEIGDFDNDGWTDVVTLNSADGSVSILLNNKSGGFEPGTIFPVGPAAAAFRATDINGDGYTDLVIVFNADNNVQIFINDTGGGFDAPVSYATGDSPTSLAVSDLNGDGNKDIAVTNSGSNSMSVLFGTGREIFTGIPDVPTLPNPVSVAIGDANGDSVNDLVVMSNGNTKAEIIPGYGTGSEYRIGYISATGASPSAQTIADFDNDGLPDLAVASGSENTVQILKGNGKGLFSSLGEPLSAPLIPTALLSADFNVDGKIDLAIVGASGAKVRIYLGQGNGSFDSGNDLSVGGAPSAIIRGDFNNDGHIDLATANSGGGSVSVLLGTGDGNFPDRVDYQTGSGPIDLVQADINNDSDTDLIVINQSARSYSTLFGNGDGTFRAQIETQLDSQPAAIVIGFFNGDGQPDLAILNDFDPSFGILLGQNDGSFTQPTNYSLPQPGKDIVTGDFNGDSFLDLLVSHGGEQSYSYLPGPGNGQFNVANDFATGLSTETLSVGDVNTDGKLDFSVASRSGGSIQMVLGH